MSSESGQKQILLTIGLPYVWVRPDVGCAAMAGIRALAFVVLRYVSRVTAMVSHYRLESRERPTLEPYQRPKFQCARRLSLVASVYFGRYTLNRHAFSCFRSCSQVTASNDEPVYSHERGASRVGWKQHGEYFSGSK